MIQKQSYKILKITLAVLLVIGLNFLPFAVNKTKAVCIPPNASGLSANPNPVAPNTPFTLTLGGSSGNGTSPMYHISGGTFAYDGASGSTTEPGISTTTVFSGYIDTQGACGDSSNTVSVTVTVLTTGTITVSTNNASATWTFPSSASNPCGTCSGTSQTYTNKTAGGYNFSAGSIAGYTVSVTSSATGGSSCSSGTACTLAAGGQINFNVTYTLAAGTVAVTTNNASATWTFPSSASNPCGTCSGTSQTYTNKTAGTYNFSPGAIYATSEVSASSGTGGSTCSSGTTCNLASGGQVNFTATYTNTTCTVIVRGWQNGNTAVATNQSYTVSGPSTVNGTNSVASQTYTLPADSSGTNYTFTVNAPASRATINGYVQDYFGVNNPNQSCTPGGTILFTINYYTAPVLQIQ